MTEYTISDGTNISAVVDNLIGSYVSEESVLKHTYMYIIRAAFSLRLKYLIYISKKYQNYMNYFILCEFESVDKHTMSLLTEELCDVFSESANKCFNGI